MADIPQIPAEADSPGEGVATTIGSVEMISPGINAPIYIRSESVRTTLRQGEIFTNVIQLRANYEELIKGNYVADRIVHPYAIVLSQDCDCIQDHYSRSKGKSLVPTILFGEVHEAGWMRDKSNTETKIDGDIWKSVRQNKNERYQFLEAVPPDVDAQNQGLPELTIDFRRFFSIPTDEFYHRVTSGEAMRRCRLASPYLEHLAGRFGYFAQRVALPKDHISV